MATPVTSPTADHGEDSHLPDPRRPDPPMPDTDETTPPRGRRRGLVWIAIVAVVAAAAAAAYYFWPRTAPASAQAPGAPAAQGTGKGFDPSLRTLPVVAEPVRKGAIDVYLNALGTVTPRNLVTVKPRVDGQLMKVHFEEGQLVKAGALLAEIDPRPFEVQLAQAAGQLAKDQALVANAQVDLDRYKTLLAQDSIARQQVDTQEALVRQYQGTIKTDQAAVDNAKLQLSYARVTAPIAGRVGLRQVDPGNVVHASDTNGIVVIAQLSPISVIFPIPEDNVPLMMQRLAQGVPTTVEAWDREGKKKLATGKLVTADNQIDTTTGTVKTKAEFANENGALFPNQFVNVRMLTQTLDDATLVPTAAIQRGAPGTFVYVVKEDKTVTVAPVKLGPAQGEVTVVTSGVRPGAWWSSTAPTSCARAKVETVTARGQAVAPPKQGRSADPPGDRLASERGKRGEGGAPPAKAP